MKKLIFLLLVFAGFMACENESIEELPQETSVTKGINARQNQKIDVCHMGKIINVSVNSLSGHQGHGDAVDMDGDGYFDLDNPCSETDCDDTDPNVNPGMEEICGDGIDNNCDGQIDEDCFPTGCWGEEFSAKFIADVALDGLGNGFYFEDCATNPNSRFIGLMTNNCGNGSYLIIISQSTSQSNCEAYQWVDNFEQIVANPISYDDAGVLFDALYDFGVANNFDDSDNCDGLGNFLDCPSDLRVNQDELLKGEGVITVEDLLRLKK